MEGLSWRSNTYSTALHVFLRAAGITPYSVVTRCGQVIVVCPSIQETQLEKM